MARVTVEDCLKNTTNRFDLTLNAAIRARAIELGSDEPKVSLDNDKPTVLALREIAEGYTFDADGKLITHNESTDTEENSRKSSGTSGLLGGSITPDF